jgi:2'-5' RNA ligase
MPATLRAFIAAELPDPVRIALGRVQADLAAAGVHARWVRPEGIHLTLRFLGQVPPEAAARAAEGLTDAVAGQPAFDLSMGGLGVFPGPRRPRVVWAGLGGDIAALEALHRRVERALGARGFQPEGRPFRAHMTLGRFGEAGAPGPVAAALASTAVPDAGPFAVRELVLFKSDLRPGGAVYTPLARAALGPGAAA